VSRYLLKERERCNENVLKKRRKGGSSWIGGVVRRVVWTAIQGTPAHGKKIKERVGAMGIGGIGFSGDKTTGLGGGVGGSGRKGEVTI